MICCLLSAELNMSAAMCPVADLITGVGNKTLLSVTTRNAYSMKAL